MNNERKVGLVMTLAVVLLMGAVFLIGKVRLGVSGYLLTLQFKFVNDLKVDAPVKYAGGPVIGRVRDITVDKDMVSVILWIDRRVNVRIREDCEFWIYTTGLLGETYVEVNASPSGTAQLIPENAAIRGVDPISIDATMIRLGKMVDALSPIFGKEEVAVSVHSMVSDFRAVARRIAAVVDKHTGTVDQALTDLEAFSTNMARMSKDAQALVSNVRLLTDPSGQESVRVTLTRLNATLATFQEVAKTFQGVALQIDQGKGTLGALLNDEKMAKDLRALVKKLKDEPITVKVRLL